MWGFTFTLGYSFVEVEMKWTKQTPLLSKGGVAAPIKKMLRSHLIGRRRGGWFKKMFSTLNEPPRPRLSKERGYFLMARPPLLCQGGEFAA